jgi:hypothetical protein
VAIDEDPIARPVAIDELEARAGAKYVREHAEGVTPASQGAGADG